MYFVTEENQRVASSVFPAAMVVLSPPLLLHHHLHSQTALSLITSCLDSNRMYISLRNYYLLHLHIMHHVFCITFFEKRVALGLLNCLPFALHITSLMTHTPIYGLFYFANNLV